ncbi:hypothetical protein H6G81_23185 [Scytonema hofmannii FACHB-248]|uniref:DUF6429 domain-containing protein n=1 Tax=Scytonema hofmannii FACHB-248 TaxID=1842502 RepID=A0ABR8GV11_9CYAN|nr:MULTISPECIES: DUF6429 family protein [Nostocales]MBD2607352.1 hypothetical protein [Scytonema hofmannii FACHB-248]
MKHSRSLPALKKNAIQLCGQDFIDSLTVKGIYAKHDELWRLVNKKLNVTDDAYEIKQAREQAEKERKLAEEKAIKQAERERLLANKKELYSKNRQGWTITVFELPESDKYGNKFVAQCTKEAELQQTTYFSNTAGDSYSQACSLVDEFEIRQDQLRLFMENYKVIKPLYLMLIYLSGWDEYNPYLVNPKNKHCKDNFVGISFWNGFNFEIVNRLEAEGLLELSTTRKTLTMTKKGMKEARDILLHINLDGVGSLLKQREYHEEYINYQSQLNILQEEQEEE